jgi:hypothetical protein
LAIRLPVTRTAASQWEQFAIWRPCISPFPTPELLLLHARQPRRSCMRRRSHLTRRMRPPPIIIAIAIAITITTHSQIHCWLLFKSPSHTGSPAPSGLSNSKHIGTDLIQCSCTHSLTHPLTHPHYRPPAVSDALTTVHRRLTLSLPRPRPIRSPDLILPCCWNPSSLAAVGRRGALGRTQRET